MAGKSKTDQYVSAYADSKKAQEAKSAKEKAARDKKAKTKSYDQQINALMADNKVILQAIKQPQFNIGQTQKEMKDLAQSFGAQPWSAGEIAQYEMKQKYRNQQQGVVNGYKKRLADNNTKIYGLTLQLNNLTNPPKDEKKQKKKSETKTTTPPKAVKPGPYKGNAPMIRSAYFAPNSPQDSTVSGNYPTRGYFQMDRITNTAAAIATAAKASKDPKHFDPSLYKFNFLYNPQTVGMTWGGVMGANPTFESLGLDASIPLAQNLLQSTITFEVILNRIEDFNYIDKYGLKSLVDTSAFNGLDPAQRNTAYKNAVSALNPYPTTVSLEDLSEIYNKGTMYDLDYLFKTMHGFNGFVNYESTLMGKTSDPGWLPIRPVELHLGNKLKYRVRVVDLSIKHSIFNARMVPLLSTVSFTCSRYWDGPRADKAVK